MLQSDQRVECRGVGIFHWADHVRTATHASPCSLLPQRLLRCCATRSTLRR